MAGPVVDILMYHSISAGDHPTQISPDAFTGQVEAIVASGVPVIDLDDLAAAHEGKFDLADRSVIITFDDAFSDFADVAWPILSRHGLKTMVYVPTGHVGGKAIWEGAASPPAPIMDWSTIEDLARDGAMFGSHSVNHPDLNSLSDNALTRELIESRNTLEDRLGGQIRHFAPPYGHADAKVRDRISAFYATSVGTSLDSASLSASRLDLPRLEMYYFRNARRLYSHLTGQGGAYFSMRKGLRRTKQLMNRTLNRG